MTTVADLAEVVAAARALLGAPDLAWFHNRTCEYIRDRKGLIFAYSPPGNTRNLIQFESTPDGQYSFGSTDPQYRDRPSDPVFERLFAEDRAAQMKRATLRERFEQLLPGTPEGMAALVVALASGAFP